MVKVLLRKRHNPEVKAAVMAALLAGQSINSVAKEYKIPKGTVSSWKNARGSQKIATQKKGAEIGDLLIGYLRENLKTLSVQAIHFRDKEWLAKQPAQEAAVLHGVLTDKSIRLLEAMESAGTDSE